MSFQTVAIQAIDPSSLTLADVPTALKGRGTCPPAVLRKQCRAIGRLATLLGDQPQQISLDLEAIGKRLDAIKPAARGLKPKTFANIKSDALSAIAASRLIPGMRLERRSAPLSARWQSLRDQIADRRCEIDLSRLMHSASRKAIDPTDVSDAVIDELMEELRTTSLRRNQNRLRRKVTIAWNKVAVRLPGLGLQIVTVPPSRRRLTRRRWADCPVSLVDDVEAYLAWCGGADPFDPAARRRALAPGTVEVRRVRLNHAITLLVENGTDLNTIRSLADLVAPEAFRTILRARHTAAEGRATYYNKDLAATLLQMAKEWVKVDAETLATLKRIASKLPTLQPGMTERNTALLRQFDDPNAFKRLQQAVERLWKEVEATEQPTQWTLAKAQATLAIAILTYIPIRLHNLAALEFDRHLHLPLADGAVATLTLPAHEVKNRRAYAAPIPPHVAAMLTAYRRKIAPKILGHQPDHLFVNRDGRRKTKATVRYLIQTYMDRHVGVDFNPHTFRHLSGKVILDAEPGSHETVRQLLGHSRLKTTTDYYTGTDTMRAAAHHQELIDTALEAPAKPRRRKAPKRER